MFLDACSPEPFSRERTYGFWRCGGLSRPLRRSPRPTQSDRKKKMSRTRGLDDGESEKLPRQSRGTVNAMIWMTSKAQVTTSSCKPLRSVPMSIHHDQAIQLACVSCDLKQDIETNSRPPQQRSRARHRLPQTGFLPFCFPFANGRENGRRSRLVGHQTGLPFGLPF